MPFNDKSVPAITLCDRFFIDFFFRLDINISIAQTKSILIHYEYPRVSTKYAAFISHYINVLAN